MVLKGRRLPSTVLRRLCTSSRSVLEPWLTVTATDGEPGDNRTYTGSGWTPPGAPGIYGGSLVCQSMAAAARNMGENGRLDLQIHSLHAHFLRPGDGKLPVVYTVEKVRDGSRFASRHVRASQGGKDILHAAVSFHSCEDEGGICDA